MALYFCIVSVCKKNQIKYPVVGDGFFDERSTVVKNNPSAAVLGESNLLAMHGRQAHAYNAQDAAIGFGHAYLLSYSLNIFD